MLIDKIPGGQAGWARMLVLQYCTYDTLKTSTVLVLKLVQYCTVRYTQQMWYTQYMHIKRCEFGIEV